MAKDFKKMAQASAFGSLLNGGEDTKEKEAPAKESRQTEETGEQKAKEELLNTITDTELKERLKARQMKDRGRRKETSSTEGYKRATFIVNEEQMEKIKILSLKEGLQQKEVLEALLNVALKHYERKYGELTISEVEASQANENLKKFDKL